MLHRVDSNGLVLISQPAHAWLSGQLAQHWGNKFFGNFDPTEEVSLAAALHDIGFLNWEQSPTLNPKTGLPHCFLDLPTRDHLELWSRSIQKMMRYGRYPALLVSLHFAVLCQKHRKFDSPVEFALEKNFLNEQDTFQNTLLTSLRNDSYYAPCATDEIIRRNRQLVSLWDWMSLSLCIGFTDERVIENVPTAEGTTELSLKAKDSSQIVIRPWPFSQSSNGKPIRLVCEGRRLLKKYTNETEMRQAMRAASPVTVKFDLVSR